MKLTLFSGTANPALASAIAEKSELVLGSISVERFPDGVAANMITGGGIDCLITVDLHNSAIEGFFDLPIEHLSAVSHLSDALRPHVPPMSVIVSPDLGAVKLAELYAILLDLPAATVHKARLSATEVRVGRVVGDVRDMAPVIVDDMVSTGATIEATVKALRSAGCTPEIIVVTTHALLVGKAAERLKALDIRLLITTDTVPVHAGSGLPVEVVSLAPLLAESVWRLQGDFSMDGLPVHLPLP